MTKAELVENLINNTTLSRSQAIIAVEGIFGSIANALCKGDNVYIRGFATFKAYTKKPRMARDFKKSAEMEIPARKSAKLVLGKQLKERMNR